MDLFNSILDGVNLSDVEGFLSLKSPESERLPEGTRIDYKEHLPNDIADHVAALANAYGGLIFIGIKPKVDSALKQNIPDAALGATTLGGDAKARIANKIVTSVHPIPDFDIGVWGTGVAGHVGAIIRVEQGIDPPYESIVSGKYRIPIRIHDSKRQASLAEIQRLLAIRESGRKTTNQTLARWQEEQKGNDYQAGLVMPAVPLRLRIDSHLEADFRSLIDPSERTLTGQERSGGQYKVNSQDKKTFSVDESGNLGFSAALTRRGSPGEWVGDAIDLLRNFCLLAHRFFDQHRYRGNLIFGHMMSCYSITFLPQFAVLNGAYKSQAISFPSVQASLVGKGVKGFKQLDIAWSDLKEPSEIVAEIMLYQLREVRQANIDFPKLVQEIRAR